MKTCKVTTVIDGDTFEVNHEWSHNGQKISRIRPTGYNAPELGKEGYLDALRKLTELIFDEEVDIGAPKKVDRGRLICDVYFRGKNLAEYFPEYQ